jgi:hypothetical protein
LTGPDDHSWMTLWLLTPVAPTWFSALLGKWDLGILGFCFSPWNIAVLLVSIEAGRIIRYCSVSD